MKKLYEALSVDVVKFEAQDVITASSGAVNEEVPAGTTVPKENNPDLNPDYNRPQL